MENPQVQKQKYNYNDGEYSEQNSFRGNVVPEQGEEEHCQVYPRFLGKKEVITGLLAK